MDEKIPVTVLTGYLGAGKTTLLNRILSEDHGRKFAVIVNEFGAIGIDNDLVIGADEEVFEMNNGCLCCTVRGDLIRIIGQIRSDKIPAVFLENLSDDRLIRQLAAETGAKPGGTLYSDSLTSEKGDSPTYIAMVRHNIRALTSALDR